MPRRPAVVLSISLLVLGFGLVVAGALRFGEDRRLGLLFLGAALALVLLGAWVGRLGRAAGPEDAAGRDDRPAARG